MPIESDFSSASLPSGLVNQAPGSTYRGLGSSIFNEANIQREDWLRNETAANNQFLREMEVLRRNQNFNSAEAQRDRDFQEYQRSTQYQVAMEDMKKAGLNPILAYQQGGAGTTGGSSASSSGSAGSGSYSPRRSRDSFVDILNFLGGMFETTLDHASIFSKKASIGF